MGSQLHWFPLMDRQDLVVRPVRDRLTQILDPEELVGVAVAEIDTEYAAGDALCEQYGVPWSEAANCLVISATRGSVTRNAACLMAPGSRSDLNGAVRRHLAARRVTMTPRQEVLDATGMEYGSITAVGLPKDWRVLIDAGYEASPALVMGSGLLRSKMRIPLDTLLKVTGGEFLPGLTRA
ncbi:YbaK/EbsC family protein [Streptomyces albogriseolus]|uniref:YbaK/EbsC family protein n=1 Tax=Streptomyces albogriseolus TaxID=1887 RepID=UPI0037028138